MAEKRTAIDFDDTTDKVSTKYALKWIFREFGISVPLDMFYDNTRLLATGQIDSMDAFLVMLNSAFMTKEYLKSPLPRTSIEAIRIGAKHGEQAILTSRPAYTNEYLLEKLDRNRLLPYLTAGVHHVPAGRTKGDVCMTEGFTKLVDDHPWHIFSVAKLGLLADGIMDHRPWNSRAHYIDLFNGELPSNVRLVSGLRHSLDPTFIAEPG